MLGFCSVENVSQYTRGALFVQSPNYFITGMAPLQKYRTEVTARRQSYAAIEPKTVTQSSSPTLYP